MIEVCFWNICNNLRAKTAIDSFMASVSHTCIMGFCEYWEIKNRISPRSNQEFIDPIRGRVGLICSSSVKIKAKKIHRFFGEFKLEMQGRVIHVFIVHLRSMSHSEKAAESINKEVCRDISTIINGSLKNEDIIVMGDFNLPHFHEAFLDFNHLNCTNYMDKEETKSFEGKLRRKLYSPLVSLVGGLHGRSPGSYKYIVRHESQSWHLFDQILLSYSLGKKIDYDSIKVLDSISSQSLLTRGGNPSQKYSDHLPIRIQLK